jgi:hypothetical protein
MLSKKIITTVCAGALLFSGCFSENSSTGSSQNNEASVLPPVNEILFDIPSALATTQSATPGLKKEAGSELLEGDLFAGYRIVPIFIGIANEAKNGVKSFVADLEKHNIKGDVTFEEDGNLIEVRSRDTTIAGFDQELFDIRISNEGVTALRMYYWKNARGEYRGRFLYRELQGVDSGNVAIVHFNNHNSAIFGNRLEVVFAQSIDKLTGDKINDPQVIRVAAIQKKEKIIITGASYAPNFTDEEGFWEDGAKIYAFAAAADVDKNLAMLRVGFAPATAKRSELLTTYALDKIMLERGTEMFKLHLSTATADEVKLLLWTVENKKSMHDYFKQTQEQIAAYTPKLKIDELQGAHLQDFIAANWVEIMTGDDEGFKQFAVFISVEQPVFLGANGRLLGTSFIEPEQWDAAIDATDLEEGNMSVLDPELVLNFDETQDVMSFMESETEE